MISEVVGIVQETELCTCLHKNENEMTILDRVGIGWAALPPGFYHQGHKKFLARKVGGAQAGMLWVFKKHRQGCLCHGGSKSDKQGCLSYGVSVFSKKDTMRGPTSSSTSDSSDSLKAAKSSSSPPSGTQPREAR